MSEKIDQFCDNLRDDLNAAEARMQKVKARIETAHSETKAAIDQKLAEAKSSIGARKAEIEAKEAKIKASIEEKKAETVGKIEEWKRNREIHKLERRADRAEEYAAWRIVVAVDALDEADVATLEAIVARFEAEEAAAG